MRIIGGKYKHLQIDAPLNDLTRPTADKTRESIFNAIQFYLYDAFVLDLFAGSGAFGIESLSRNAKYVTFVDNNDIAIKTINNNLNKLKISDCFDIIKDDYSTIAKLDKKYNIIFMDPPYKYDIFDDLLNIIETNNLLEEHGIIVFETNEEHNLKIEKYPNYKIKQYKYGIAFVNILYKI